MRTVVRQGLVVAAFACALVAGGCPSYVLKNFSLVPDSVKPGAFGLGFQVEVTNPRDDPDEEPEKIEGHGLIGIWLPEGWKATTVRMKAPDADDFADLSQHPELVPGFPKTFPYVPGNWFPFATECLAIGEGVHAFEFQVDASGPEDQTRVTVGLVAGLFEDDVNVGMVNTELTIDLTEQTATEQVIPGRHSEEVESSLEPCLEPIPDGDGQEEIKLDCPACPLRVDRGKRGCSCAAVGRSAGPLGLLGLLAEVLLRAP
jgi:hypothetical protein